MNKNRGSNYFIVAQKDLYFYSYEDACMQIYKTTIFNRLIKVVCSMLKVAYPKIFVLKETKNKLQNASNIVITDYAASVAVIKYLKKYSKANIILYYMNEVTNKNKGLMDYVKTVYTFDAGDAKTFNIYFKHTPYTKKIQLDTDSIEYDVLFLGRNKKRINEILSVKEMLESLGIKGKFLVYNCDNKEIKIDRFINYQEYIRMVSKTKCVLEINKKDQEGCSLRFLESLFLKKKLITNNKKIINDEYYNKNNVFILGVDDNKRLKEFITLPYDNSSAVNIDELNFVNWLESF